MKKILATLTLIVLQAMATSALADVADLTARAEAGEAGAQFLLAHAYDYGRGAPKDKASALTWYRRAAEQGHVDAQNSLGSILQEDKRYAEALQWYTRAAAQGSAEGISNEAYLHDLGLGVPQDRQKGFVLYARAAALGWSPAMWNIANMYAQGQLGPADELLACVWTVRAQKYATPRDIQLLAHLNRILPLIQRKLGPETAAACQQQADAWSPTQG